MKSRVGTPDTSHSFPEVDPDSSPQSVSSLPASPPPVSPALPEDAVDQPAGPSLLLPKQRAAGELATKIWKGKKVREQIVLPTELYQHFLANPAQVEALLDRPLHRWANGDLIPSEEETLQNLSRAIAREILNLPKKGIELSAGPVTLELGKAINEGNTYRFPSLELAQGATKPQDVRSPAGIIISQHPSDPRSIDIKLVGPQKGAGTYKTVYASLPLSINLRDTQRQAQSTTHAKESAPKALQVPKAGKSQVVDNGFAIVKSAFTPEELADPEFRLAGLLHNTGQKHEGETLFLDELHKGSLWDNRSMPDAQKLQVLADAAGSLKRFHNKGLVHRDVKSQNILVGNDGRGYLNDFDFVQKAGKSPVAGEYPYWDLGSRQGKVTPFTDAFGLAQAASEVFYSRHGGYWGPSIDDAFADNLDMVFRADHKIADQGVRNQIARIFLDNMQDLASNDPRRLQAVEDRINEAHRHMQPIAPPASPAHSKDKDYEVITRRFMQAADNRDELKKVFSELYDRRNLRRLHEDDIILLLNYLKDAEQKHRRMAINPWRRLAKQKTLEDHMDEARNNLSLVAIEKGIFLS